MVASQRFPYVEIWFKVREFEKQVFAYIDTGFDGFLIVPAEFSKSFGKADLVSVWSLETVLWLRVLTILERSRL